MNERQFRKECFEAHNAYRKSHGAPPLEELAELSDFAQEWAERLAKYNEFKHSHKEGYGENIAYKEQSGEPTGQEITKMWYEEVDDYSWNTHGSKAYGKVIGHFTQVVWKSTTHAGFGLAQNGRRYYVVGSYHPPGNISNPGYYKDNVGKKGDQVVLTQKENTKEGTETGEKSEDSSSDNDDDSKPGNKLSRKDIKDFRKSFLDRVNRYRVAKDMKGLEKVKDLQKKAQKCANYTIKGKQKRDQVRTALRLVLSTLVTGDKAVEDIEDASHTREQSKHIFDSLMSTELAVIGIGVSSEEESGIGTSHIIIYLG